jgi:hypothetical protein
MFLSISARSFAPSLFPAPSDHPVSFGSHFCSGTEKLNHTIKRTSLFPVRNAVAAPAGSARRLTLAISIVFHFVVRQFQEAGMSLSSAPNSFVGTSSIRAKALSRHTYLLQCFEHRVIAREGGGPRLWKVHGESLLGGIVSTNHRYGLNVDHDFSMRTPIRHRDESAQSTRRSGVSRPGAPASCSR